MHITSDFDFSKKILFWHQNNNQQILPWQLNKTIYTIWLSEIMLQQTQVCTVIPYYQKFIKKFPTVFQLAKSSLNEVLYIWSGLGYYRRAINLHTTAKIIVESYNSQFPRDFKTLISLPGIGRSTAGAILSLALNKRHPILDGNIKRILIRYYALDNYTINQSKVNNNLWFLIEQLLPDTNTSSFNQAMMNLGRLICTYLNPKCNICPINKNCQSFLLKKIDQYPQKKNVQKKTKQTIWWLLLFVKHRKIVWLSKRSREKIWRGLFCFPEFCDINTLNIWLSQNDLHNNLHNEIITSNHKISNIDLTIQTVILNLQEIIYFNNASINGIWYNLNKPNCIGIPKPVSIILKDLYATSSIV